MAFCDWSEVQRKRRDLLKDHTFPKVYSNGYQTLDRLVCEEMKKMIEDFKDEANNNNNNNNVCAKKSVFNVFNEPKLSLISKKMEKLLQNKHVETIVRFPYYLKSENVQEEEPAFSSRPVDVKRKLLLTTGNIFLRYFCSTGFDDTPEFDRFVTDFDQIFYEVNQGYAYDFLPALSLFYQSDMKRVQKHSANIRNFVLENVIKNRSDGIRENSPEKDYVDALLKNVKFDKDVRLDLESALFSLEDIIGGHSAVANFLVKLLTFLVQDENVQRKIKEEAETRGKDFITLDDRCFMPYTEAVVMETLRLLSSPIVPHVANQDTTISGKSCPPRKPFFATLPFSIFGQNSPNFFLRRPNLRHFFWEQMTFLKKADEKKSQFRGFRAIEFSDWVVAGRGV